MEYKAYELDRNYSRMLEYFRPPKIPVKVIVDGTPFFTIKNDFMDVREYVDAPVIVAIPNQPTNLGYFMGWDTKTMNLIVYSYIYDHLSKSAYWRLWGRMYVEKDYHNNQREIVLMYNYISENSPSGIKITLVRPSKANYQTLDSELVSAHRVFYEEGLEEKLTGFLLEVVTSVKKRRHSNVVSPF